MSAHIEVTGTRDWHAVLTEVADVVRERFGIAHATLQPEEPHALPDAFRGCTLDSPEGRNACRVLHAGAATRPHDHAH